MNSLRSSQLSAMLFLSAAFTILCQTASWTMEGIFGTGIAVAVQFLLCVPISCCTGRASPSLTAT